MSKSGYIYFMSNRYNTVLYVGVSHDLARRVAEHKGKIKQGFTRKYNCDKLVYFESYSDISDAISREKQLKNWKREWKNALVNEENADWRDLSEDLGVDQEYVEAVRVYYEGIADQVRNDSEGEDEEIADQVRNDTNEKGIAGLARNDSEGEDEEIADQGRNDTNDKGIAGLARNDGEDEDQEIADQVRNDTHEKGIAGLARNDGEDEDQEIADQVRNDSSEGEGDCGSRPQ